MPKCEICERKVNKLLSHPFRDEKVCYKCMTRTGYFTPEQFGTIDIKTNERRAYLRIPISIEMSFLLFDEEKKAKISYPAYTVDLSVAGICFAWEHCLKCRGYDEGSVHPDCLFISYSIFADKENRRNLNLSLTLGDSCTLEIPCQIVYTLKEHEMDIEYVGARFVGLNKDKKLILETIMHKFGNL